LAPAAPAAAAPATTGEVCPGVAPPRLRSAAPDATLNALFTGYGNDNRRSDDWTGADSTYRQPRRAMAEPLRPTLSDAFTDQVIDLIRTEGLRPGDRLPSAQALARRFAVATPDRPGGAAPPRGDRRGGAAARLRGVRRRRPRPGGAAQPGSYSSWTRGC
jgi:hypothetical protein